MKAQLREYREGDIQYISQFFNKMIKNNYNLNFLKCAWECFSKHPCFVNFRPEEFGIWEDNEEIVGLVCLESPWNGTVYIDLHPSYCEIYEDMITYAEKHFSDTDENGKKYLNIRTLGLDKELQEALTMRGYIASRKHNLVVYSLIEQLIPTQTVPKGFKIKSLKDVYDFNMLNVLLWKAFNYEGEPPAYDDDVKLSIKHAWLEYRRDICTVILAPDDSYAAFCGMWFDEESQEVFLEPAITAEQYRNIGLGKACIYTSFNKCKEIGSKYVYVEPDESAFEFYKNIGFRDSEKKECIWKKTL